MKARLIDLGADAKVSGFTAAERKALALTSAIYTVGIAVAAVAADFVVHRVLTNDGAAFTPLETLLIAVVIAAPVNIYLQAQRFRLRRAGEALAVGSAQMDRIVSELVQRREEADAARAKAQQAMEQLAESESHYRLMTDRMSDVVVRYDPAGMIEFASSSVRQYGYEPEQLVGRNLAEFTHPEDEPEVGASRSHVAATGEFIEVAGGSFRVRTGDGQWVRLEARPTAITDDAGEIIGVVSVMRDVTARHAMEAELRLRRVEAEQAVAAKSDFLANMTHELRTPLNAIVGFSGLLRKSAQLAAGDRRQADLIYDAGQTLLHVVNDVLDYSKLEAGGIEMESFAFEPAAIAESVCDILGDQAVAKALTLSVVVEGDRAPLLGDGARLRQVLLNLVSNAIKFTARGGVDILVRQTPAEGGQQLEIEVTDTGIGLRPDQLDAIFGRFTQADASISRKFGGTGLGLAISRRIVEAMGGTIGVRSVEGQGATFWLSLTLPHADGAAGPAAESQATPVIERALRLLVVEDNKVNQELIIALLSPFELAIETAGDGVEAVEAAARGAFDVILMDVQMPNMDGLAATRHIRAAAPPGAPRTPIIAMTANVMPEQVARCLEAGMDDHIGKPIDPARLLQLLDRWSPGEATEPSAVAAAG